MSLIRWPGKTGRVDSVEADMTEQKHGRRILVTGVARQDDRLAALKLPLVKFLESLRMNDLDLTREEDTGREVDL